MMRLFRYLCLLVLLEMPFVSEAQSGTKPTVAIIKNPFSGSPAHLTRKLKERLSITVQGYKRRTLYHSPQTPGFTCWASIWRTWEGEAAVTFTQATGAIEGWHPRAPKEVLRRMPLANQQIEGYDMTGRVLENIYLRSSDNGRTWRKTGTEPFESCLNGMTGSGIATLPDGTTLRNIWGQALPYWDVPSTGMVQRSTDGGKTWGAPATLSKDLHLQTWPKRIRMLRDGRVLMTGAACTYEQESWTWEAQIPRIRPCLWVSRERIEKTSDIPKSPEQASGLTWGEPLYLTPEGTNFVGEEWDVVELENGDLLGVMRTASFDAKGKFLGQERRQCLLTKRGATWIPSAVAPAPFPHSGHPELLQTREGVTLHIASNGISWTSDRGATWTKLAVPGTAYYPSAIQMDNGLILVVSHVGSDDAYGKGDQSIVLDVFRLSVKRVKD
ncbi:MAG: sialidase family protein [Armatimonadetes bacterium]|nr:sialidase family protein [Armatimonadota bacterium]